MLALILKLHQKFNIWKNTNQNFDIISVFIIFKV